MVSCLGCLCPAAKPAQGPQQEHLMPLPGILHCGSVTVLVPPAIYTPTHLASGRASTTCSFPLVTFSSTCCHARTCPRSSRAGYLRGGAGHKGGRARQGIP